MSEKVKFKYYESLSDYSSRSSGDIAFINDSSTFTGIITHDNQF